MSPGLSLHDCEHIMQTIAMPINGTDGSRGGVAQWVARLTRDRWIPISRVFEPHQSPPLFP